MLHSCTRLFYILLLGEFTVKWNHRHYLCKYCSSRMILADYQAEPSQHNLQLKMKTPAVTLPRLLHFLVWMLFVSTHNRDVLDSLKKTMIPLSAVICRRPPATSVWPPRQMKSEGMQLRLCCSATASLSCYTRTSALALLTFRLQKGICSSKCFSIKWSGPSLLTSATDNSGGLLMCKYLLLIPPSWQIHESCRRCNSDDRIHQDVPQMQF